eukprot:TRINITY_DN885_c0_g1_i1.p1 TRINITY_DN885_c0_g1~~TRINITY_DN885_c0_g1_i1.p1  ORF type:complete len:832 (+),score=-136.14 TRINITY_DN885_c0_g1_i1:42-2498(+)
MDQQPSQETIKELPERPDSVSDSATELPSSPREAISEVGSVEFSNPRETISEVGSVELEREQLKIEQPAQASNPLSHTGVSAQSNQSIQSEEDVINIPEPLAEKIPSDTEPRAVSIHKALIEKILKKNPFITPKQESSIGDYGWLALQIVLTAAFCPGILFTYKMAQDTVHALIDSIGSDSDDIVKESLGICAYPLTYTAQIANLATGIFIAHEALHMCHFWSTYVPVGEKGSSWLHSIFIPVLLAIVYTGLKACALFLEWDEVVKDKFKNTYHAPSWQIASYQLMQGFLGLYGTNKLFIHGFEGDFNVRKKVTKLMKMLRKKMAKYIKCFAVPDNEQDTRDGNQLIIEELQKLQRKLSTLKHKSVINLFTVISKRRSQRDLETLDKLSEWLAATWDILDELANNLSKYPRTDDSHFTYSRAPHRLHLFAGFLGFIPVAIHGYDRYMLPSPTAAHVVRDVLIVIGTLAKALALYEITSGYGHPQCQPLGWQFNPGARSVLEACIDTLGVFSLLQYVEFLPTMETVVAIIHHHHDIIVLTIFALWSTFICVPIFVSYVMSTVLDLTLDFAQNKFNKIIKQDKHINLYIEYRRISQALLEAFKRAPELVMTQKFSKGFKELCQTKAIILMNESHYNERHWAIKSREEKANILDNERQIFIHLSGRDYLITYSHYGKLREITINSESLIEKLKNESFSGGACTDTDLPKQIMQYLQVAQILQNVQNNGPELNQEEIEKIQTYLNKVLNYHEDKNDQQAECETGPERSTEEISIANDTPIQSPMTLFKRSDATERTGLISNDEKQGNTQPSKPSLATVSGGQ